MKSLPLKESTMHRTANFPLACYEARCCSENPDSSFQCKHHWHEELEIIFFEKGTYLLEVNMEQYEITESCFCFINNAELHAIRGKGGYQESAIVFSPSILCFQMQGELENHFLNPLTNNEINITRFIRQDHPCFDPVRSLYEDILHRCPAGIYGRQQYEPPVSIVNQLYIKSDLLRLFALLQEHHLLHQDVPVPDKRIEIIKGSLTYMKEHYADLIRVSDLARHANLNEQYYCRFFKKIIGKTPIEYLIDLRIRQAMDRLENTQASIVDISLACGFNNLGNFINTFRQHTGMTPLQYRKSHPSRPSEQHLQ